jgi:hypothetical protein
VARTLRNIVARDTRRLIVVAGLLTVLLGAAVGAGVAVLLEAEDDGPERASALLAAANDRIAGTLERYGRAGSLAELRAAGAFAERAQAPTLAALETAETAGLEPRLRGSVTALLTAQFTVLQALGRPAALKPSSLWAWREMRDDLDQAAAGLEVAWRGFDVEIEGVRRPPDLSRRLREVTSEADRSLRRAQRRLRDWQRKRRKALRARRADIAVLDAYATTMSGYLDQYSRLRSEMSDWIAKVDSEGVTFREAYDVLGEASTDRQRVRDGIAALDAPAALAEEHNALLGVIDEAIAAVDAAIEGTADYQFDFADEYASYRDAPGWERFTTSSSAISGRYAAARAAWAAERDRERQRIAERGVPKRPEI